MKKKLLKRYMTVALLVLVALGFLSQKFGFFNSFIYRFEDQNMEAKRIQTSTAADSNPSAAYKDGSNENPDSPDAVSGATQNTEGDQTIPQETNEPLTSVQLNNHSLVSVVQSEKATASELDYNDIQKMVKDSINLAGGLGGIVKNGQTVVLKPNLVQKHSDVTGKLFAKELNGITTDWRVTKAVAEIVRELNPRGKIYVMEGSAGDNTKETMEYLNYTHDFIPTVDEFIAIEDDSGKWQEFDSPSLVKVPLPAGLLHKEYYLNKKYKEADVLISIPTLKNNSGTVVTGGIKNVAIGATPANIYGPSKGNLSRTKMVSHSFSNLDLQQWIYDYYMCKPVDFVVMDGLEGFQNGPAPSKKDSEIKDKMNMRLIVAGKDAIAVDTVECLITGWDPQSAAYLRYLDKSGMGNLDTSKITVAGSRVDQVRKAFQTKIENPGWVRAPFRKGIALTLEKCSFSDNKLELSVSSKEAVKVEIYIDNSPIPLTFTSDFKSISINAGSFLSGSHSIKVCAYDRFLNYGEEKAEAVR